jgi:hypothetical protein
MTSKGPEFKKDAFTCPLCHVYARFLWSQTIFSGQEVMNTYLMGRCSHCNQLTFWRHISIGGKGAPGTWFMVYPSQTKKGPAPHSATPTEIAKDYEEARSIAAQSARGAAALLRLIVQKLCAELGEDASNLNGAIGNLVKKGLPAEIQQALDVVRVVGNITPSIPVKSPLAMLKTWPTSFSSWSTSSSRTASPGRHESRRSTTSFLMARRRRSQNGIHERCCGCG